MSVQESRTGHRTRPSVPPRRIRHQVLDGVGVAGFSLGASVAATAVIWLALRWLS